MPDTSVSTALVDQLRSALGDPAVRTGPEISSRHDCDWTGLHPHHPDVLLLPADTGQVSRALAICHAAGQPVVVQGGLTGLAGGATPRPGEVALSLERLNGIEALDADALTLTAGAGTPLQVLKDAADAAGLVFPLDLGARGSCQIGGNVATNAGGNNVIRYGMARSLVLGLEAVLADGTVIRAMNQLLKNNAGLDLKHLFIGGEGQLGVITRLVLRLYPRPTSRTTVLCALPDAASAIGLLRDARARFCETLTAYEVMWPDYYQTVFDRFDRLSDPFDQPHGGYVLIEVQGTDAERDAEAMEALVGQALEEGQMSDAVLASSLSQAQALWDIRDAAGELIPVMNVPAVFDIGVPIGAMVDFVDTVNADVQAAHPGVQSVCFGHIGDGNLHYMVDCASEQQRADMERIVYTRTGRVGGSVAAEHGIGVHKKPYLGESRSEAEIALMRRLKEALDPAGILNPGRVTG